MDNREEWRPVLRYEGIYEVSNLGHVRSLDRWVRRGNQPVTFLQGTIMKPMNSKASHGYNTLTLSAATNGYKRFNAKIYRLVAEAFLGPRPSPIHVVNHKNGDKTDDRADNLEWVTQSSNMKHASHMGLMRKGEGVKVSKLTSAQVLEIRKRRTNGEKLESIAAAYGIAPSTACQIAKGQVWKHLLPSSAPGSDDLS